jgi:hypothetical protein
MLYLSIVCRWRHLNRIEELKIPPPFSPIGNRIVVRCGLQAWLAELLQKNSVWQLLGACGRR